MTVCDNAEENSLYFPANIKVIHHFFADPANVEGDEETWLASLRPIRNQIQEYFNNTFIEIIGKE